MTNNEHFIKLAFDISKHSKAIRLKVGAIIVDSTNNIISSGSNNMPKIGFSSCCEYINDNNELTTRPDLIHAEENAIGYAAKRGYKCEGATIFITDSPCLQCAKLIYSAGIKKVVYCRKYRIDAGLWFLEKVGIEVEQIKFDYNG